MYDIKNLPSILQKWKQNSLLLKKIQKLQVINIATMGRLLTPIEIKQLEKNGNSCSDWSLIRVASNFLVTRVQECHFMGENYLPCFSGQIDTPYGTSILTGLKNSHFSGCVIHNSVIHDVRFLSHMYVSSHSILLNVSSFTWNVQKPIFPLPFKTHVGDETGSRSIWIWEGMDMEFAEWCALQPQKEQQLMEIIFNKFLKELETPLGFIGDNTYLFDVLTVEDSWIDSYCFIQGSQVISHSFLQGSENCRVEVKHGSQLHYSYLMEGSRVLGGAHVEYSVMFKKASVDLKATVNSSLIGSYTTIKRGEVVNSIVGPLVGFHHQALLISTLWSKGRGNVSYCSAVGSNHTGRQPNQELHCGEGIFFGMNCSVKFPVNLLESPYSLISANTTLSSQKISCPFSLIVSATSQQHSSILPAWMWWGSAYTLFRNSYKFEDRAPEISQDKFFFQDEIVKLVLQVLREFKNLKDKKIYTYLDCALLGVNSLTHYHLEQAIKGYHAYLYLWLVQQKIQNKIKAPLAITVSTEVSPMETVQNCILLNSYKLDQILEWIVLSSQKDFSRGKSIINDYDSFHVESDDLIKRMKTDISFWKAEALKS